MPTARERQQKRRQRREMARKVGPVTTQAAPEGSRKLPEFKIPGGRWFVLIPAAGLIFIAVLLVLRLINPPADDTPPNAIWLDKDWAYDVQSTESILQLTNDLRTSNIGTIFLYTSSLRADGTWSGLEAENNRFSEVEPLLDTVIDQLRESYPNISVYAWIEINTQTPDYRLDRPQIQNTIASFSQRTITSLDFDGVLLDVKPLFEENEDYIQLLRTVKRQIGIDTDLIVAVPPDLTPTGTQLNLPNLIAPGTEWSAEYKQRVALLANQIVITAYNSYHDNPVDYIEWVSYQVTSYVDVLSALDSNTSVLLSVPNYASNSQAHQSDIETLAAGLDGATRSLTTMDEATQSYFAGVAIFTDEILTDEEWIIYRDRWSR